LPLSGGLTRSIKQQFQDVAMNGTMGICPKQGKVQAISLAGPLVLRLVEM
jgi:hypothetical protein